MQVKRYHAEDMKQAMDAAIRELGSDAVMIAQNKVRRKGFKGWFRKPILEVQFAYDPADIPAAKKKKALSTLDKEGPELVSYQPSGGGAPQFGGSFSLDGSSSQGKAISPGKLPPLVDAPSPGSSQSLGGQSPGGQSHGGQSHGGQSLGGSNEQFELLDKRINSIETMLSNFYEKFEYVKRDVTYDYSEEVQKILSRLIEAQVEEKLAHSIAKQAEQLLKQQSGTNATEVIEHLILEQFGRSAPILHKKFTQSVILVLGPTGVGKTTSIVKLAADFSVKQKKNVGIINTDTYRIGAQEQLQTYADILGVPIRVVYHAHELDKAMEHMSDRDIIFVDTAGKRPGDDQHKEDLLEIVRILKPEDTLLCLAATTSFASIKEMVDTYGFVDDYRVMITKLDETKYRGTIMNISWYTQRPLAYVTTGQDVAKDIEIADAEALVKQMVRN